MYFLFQLSVFVTSYYYRKKSFLSDILLPFPNLNDLNSHDMAPKKPFLEVLLNVFQNYWIKTEFIKIN